jgi:hypothetical protein
MPCAFTGGTWAGVVKECILGALATKLITAETEVVSIYHRRVPFPAVLSAVADQGHLPMTWVWQVRSHLPQVSPAPFSCLVQPLHASFLKSSSGRESALHKACWVHPA